MNSKLNKKKVAFVGVLFFLIIILVIILIINLNKPSQKEPVKKEPVVEKKEEKKKEDPEVNFTISFAEIVPLETMLDKLMMGRLIKNIKSKEKIQLIF